MRRRKSNLAILPDITINNNDKIIGDIEMGTQEAINIMEPQNSIATTKNIGINIIIEKENNLSNELIKNNDYNLINSNETHLFVNNDNNIHQNNEE